MDFQNFHKNLQLVKTEQRFIEGNVLWEGYPTWWSKSENGFSFLEL